MFLKALFPFNIIGIVLLLGGCSAGISTTADTVPTERYISRYLVPNQLPAPETIKSIQLYRTGSVNNPPIIELETNQKLTLAFDELTDLSGQFRIIFTHHDRDWNESNIPQDWYLDGMNELIVGGGNKNQLSSPSYFHYETEFPNQQVQFKISGNYMLHVVDFTTGTRLFSLPFYVTENTGEMRSRVETKYNAGPRGQAVDRPFSEFIYPDFVEYPQFDLSFYFAQNRFWGDRKQSENYDFSEEDRTQFHLSEENAFSSNFDFIGLRLNEFSVDGRQIIDWHPEKTPPEVVLREDILNFSSDPSRGWGASFANPKTSENTRYANVRFRFQDGGQFSASDGVYLVGDFNQWILEEENKLTYNENSGYWETTALIKQGTYTYKYAIKENQDEIDDLTLSDTITRQNQEYTSFVYFQDPDYRYHRLLHVQTFRSGS
ncbi:MAG: type IX secretion system plug protein domain-containing protein [Gracilimonas sp.]